MEKIRTDNNSKESGIALVTTLVITVVIMMLIGGLSYLYLKGLGAVVINKEFTTVYEAANGGVEYTVGIIIDYLKNPDNPPSQIRQFDTVGQLDPDDEETFKKIIKCTDTNLTAQLIMKSADGRFLITAEIRCLGHQSLPGEGGVLRFPPPPGRGGLKGKANIYSFYSIRATATEAGRPENIARTEAVYRYLQ